MLVNKYMERLMCCLQSCDNTVHHHHMHIEKLERIEYDEFFYELCRIYCEWSINLNPQQINTYSSKSFFDVSHRQTINNAFF